MTTLARAFTEAGYVSPSERLREAAAEVVLSCKNRGWSAARQSLEERVRHDPDLMWEMFKQYRYTAISAALREAAASSSTTVDKPPSPYEEALKKRSTLKREAKQEADGAKRKRLIDDGLAVLHQLVQKAAWYDNWHLSDGSLLLEADRGALEKEVGHERAISSEAWRRVRLYERLIDQVPKGGTVRDLGHEQLVRLREEAYAALPPT